MTICVWFVQGYFGLYTDNVDLYWISSATIQRNAVVKVNEYIYSPNKKYLLVLQSDSNLFIYDSTVKPRVVAAALWATNVYAGASNGPYSLQMQVYYIISFQACFERSAEIV